MAEEDTTTKLPFGVDFGQFIAFFLPGLVAVLGISFVFPSVAGLIASLEQGEKVGGPGLLLACAVLAMGLILSAVRTIVLDGLFIRTKWVKTAGAFDFKKLDTSEKKWAFEGAVQNYYRFSQFYGNMMLAEVVFGLSRYVLSDACIAWTRGEWGLLAGLLGTGLVLLVASRNQLNSMYKVMASLM
jgi:hypothetical protein